MKNIQTIYASLVCRILTQATENPYPVWKIKGKKIKHYQLKTYQKGSTCFCYRGKMGVLPRVAYHKLGRQKEENHIYRRPRIINPRKVKERETYSTYSRKSIRIPSARPRRYIPIYAYVSTCIDPHKSAIYTKLSYQQHPRRMYSKYAMSGRRRCHP